MYKYVGDISNIAHYIIMNFIQNKEVAIDGTLGNGHDTDFLSRNFKEVYSFDIQKGACDKYLKICPGNVKVINNSHENILEYVDKSVDCIMYNLGFLPGGDKSITTNHDSSLKSIKSGLKILAEGGIMTIALYRGHEEGKKEEEIILSYLKQINKSQYGVMIHNFHNRSEEAPMLIVIEKNQK
ncbi:MAG: rRNA methylase [Clostridiales bacterium]|nr:rRNA methylase [Clostridiales bacterium]